MCGKVEVWSVAGFGASNEYGCGRRQEQIG